MAVVGYRNLCLISDFQKELFTILLTVTLVQQHKYCAGKNEFLKIKEFFPKFLSVNIEKCKSSPLSSQQDNNIKITTTVPCVMLGHITMQIVSNGLRAKLNLFFRYLLFSNPFNVWRSQQCSVLDPGGRVRGEEGAGKGWGYGEGPRPSEEAGQCGLWWAPTLVDVHAAWHRGEHRGDSGHGRVGQVCQGGGGAGGAHGGIGDLWSWTWRRPALQRGAVWCLVHTGALLP